MHFGSLLLPNSRYLRSKVPKVQPSTVLEITSLNKTKSSKSQKSWRELREEGTKVARGKREKKKKALKKSECAFVSCEDPERSGAKSRGGGVGWVGGL